MNRTIDALLKNNTGKFLQLQAQRKDVNYKRVYHSKKKWELKREEAWEDIQSYWSSSCLKKLEIIVAGRQLFVTEKLQYISNHMQVPLSFVERGNMSCYLQKSMYVLSVSRERYQGLLDFIFDNDFNPSKKTSYLIEKPIRFLNVNYLSWCWNKWKEEVRTVVLSSWNVDTARQI